MRNFTEISYSSKTNSGQKRFSQFLLFRIEILISDFFSQSFLKSFHKSPHISELYLSTVQKIPPLEIFHLEQSQKYVPQSLLPGNVTINSAIFQTSWTSPRMTVLRNWSAVFNKLTTKVERCSSCKIDGLCK